ncbi:chaperone protein DnaJ [Nitzschia inconspicua]|uniref:Chaperone protein DnaJ n=1 Tax=Nitzschia inconspicua TaxID=303405 RepID=A0A9K3L0J6_9STRA|nr:chaperone protein DnaJ [Nitzschia inconspicua]
MVDHPAAAVVVEPAVVTSSSSTKKCKFGVSCNRKHCQFVHPTSPPPTVTVCLDDIDDPEAEKEEADVGNASVSVSSTKRPSPAVVAKKKKTTTTTKKKKKVNMTKKNKLCRHGANCRHMTTTCPFRHPETEEMKKHQTEKEEHQSTSAAMNTSTATTSTTTSTTNTTTNAPSSPPPLIRSSKNGMIMCRLGNNCHRKKCPFTHPPSNAALTTTRNESPSDALANGTTETSITQNDSPMLPLLVPPANPNLSLPDLLTVEELERAMFSSSSATTKTTTTTIQMPPFLLDDHGSGDIDALLRQQELERLQLLATEGDTIVHRHENHHHQQQQQELFQAQHRIIEHEREIERQRQVIRQQTFKIEQQQLEIERLRQQLAMAQQQQQQEVCLPPSLTQEADPSTNNQTAKQQQQHQQQQQQPEKIQSPGRQKGQPKPSPQQPNKPNQMNLVLQKEQGTPREQQQQHTKAEYLTPTIQIKASAATIKNESVQQEGAVTTSQAQPSLNDEEDEQLRLAIEASLEESVREEQHRRRKDDESHHKPDQDLLDRSVGTVKDKEAREDYKAQRNAAKKERRRQERQAKDKEAEERAKNALAALSSPTKTSNRVTISEPSTLVTLASSASSDSFPKYDDDEMDRKSDATVPKMKESKAEKKRKKIEQRLQELEKEAKERAAFWEPEIAKELDAVPKLVQLCIGELCRKNPEYLLKEMSENNEIVERLRPLCRDSFRKLSNAELHSRVVIKGMGKKQQDMNDRNGTILFWDESKSKYEVSIEGKKGNTFTLLVHPGNLEAVLNQKSRKKKDMKSFGGYTISINDLYKGVGVLLDLDKKMLQDLVAAKSTEDFVAKFIDQQNYLEDLEEIAERQREQEEEEERRRRAERKRQEDEYWQERRRQYAEQKNRYKQWRRDERRQRRKPDRSGWYFFTGPDGRGVNYGYTPSGMGGRHGMNPFEYLFHMGVHMEGQDFYEYVDCDDEDEWDRRWEEMHEEDMEGKNEEMAEILGVDVDAGPEDIRRVYRRKALMYHPDKYNPNNLEGLTKHESEEKFKEIQNAYDHLMANFD